jgi:hypothetical protein
VSRRRVEALEDPLQGFGRDSVSPILDRDDEVVGVAERPKLDGTV